MEQLTIPKPPRGLTRDAVVKLVGDTIFALNQLRCNPDTTRRGGFIAILDRETGETVVHAKIGVIPQVDDVGYGSKERKYRELSMKKAHQLRVLAKTAGHISGWQNRDEDLDQYGGAVIGTRFVFAFSGLSEHCDEIVGLILADAFDAVDPWPVVTISQNPFWAAIQPWWVGSGPTDN